VRRSKEPVVSGIITRIRLLIPKGRRMLRFKEALVSKTAKRIRDVISKSLGALATAAVSYLFLDFLSPFSLLFALVLALAVLTVVLFLKSRFGLASLVLLTIATTLGTTSATANYFIASDQKGLRLRTTDHGTYLEFPKSAALILNVVKRFSPDQLIEVSSCAGKSIAQLPLLPVLPIKLGTDDPQALFEYRRLPNISIKEIELTVDAAVKIRGPGESELSAGLGERSGNGGGDVALLFPRTVGCYAAKIPLLAALEMLPWTPNAVGDVVEAAARIMAFRKSYLLKEIDLEETEILTGSPGEPGAILEFIRLFVVSRMLSGSVLLEAKARLIDKMCVLLKENSDTFVGPFSQFRDNLYVELAYEYGPNSRAAFRTCEISDEHIRVGMEFRKVEANAAMGSDAEFEKCLEDKPDQPSECFKPETMRPRCIGTSCDREPSNLVSQRDIFTKEDARFKQVVVAKSGNLTRISRMNPLACPNLRDRFENDHFVDWWQDEAHRMATEKSDCASADWKSRFDRAKRIYSVMDACRSTPSDWPSDLYFDFLYELACEPEARQGSSGMSRSIFIKAVDDLEVNLARLVKFRTFLGGEVYDDVISAFDQFLQLRIAACGDLKAEACFQKYSSLDDLSSLMEMVAEKFMAGWKLKENFDARETFEHLSESPNIIISMMLCDILRSDEKAGAYFGVDPVRFCRDRDLDRFRMLASRYVESFTTLQDPMDSSRSRYRGRRGWVKPY
jgi:hypothetical protein